MVPVRDHVTFDDALMQRVIEKVLINPLFFEKLTSAIAENLKKQSKEIKA